MGMINPKYREKLEPLIQTLPSDPGVYQFYDDSGHIIYIGKAKNLKKRVASYFNRDQSESGKVRIMVKRIADIRHIVVDTELDALLLENNLIKKYLPRYNVLLKDDKTFPWICIRNEPFPRIFPTRRLLRDGSRYYGPYASVRMMHTLLQLIRQLFQYRTCRLNLTRQNIEAGKFTRCLEYHIGNCKAPCEGLQDEQDYMETMEQIETILKGNLSLVTAQLRKLMQTYAGELAFEKAAIVKEKLELLEKFQSKSMVVSATIHNVDVFSIISDSETAYVNFLKVVDGAIVQSHTLEIRKKLEEEDSRLLDMAITELRQRFASEAKEVIIPLKPETSVPGIRFMIPQRGDKKKLLELSERNAKYYKLEKQKQKELVDPDRHTSRIMQIMQDDLQMNKPPMHVECFDISNTQGSYTVAAMVVFRKGRPSKKEYRHFNIRTVEGPNDYASMQEAIQRRYKRLLAEKHDLPDLLIVDGGKGQLNATVAVLEQLGIRDRLPVIGIAKRLEEIYFPGDPVPLYIDKRSASLKVIQHMRDEAHRFGINHHRNRREKGSLHSLLSDIKGIGPKSVDVLLNTFGSVTGIKKADFETLAKAVGPSKAKLLQTFFRESEQK
jgi:excinuclease ABC subunit C